MNLTFYINFPPRADGTTCFCHCHPLTSCSVSCALLRATQTGFCPHLSVSAPHPHAQMHPNKSRSVESLISQRSFCISEERSYCERGNICELHTSLSTLEDRDGYLARGKRAAGQPRFSPVPHFLLVGGRHFLHHPASHSSAASQPLLAAFPKTLRGRRKGRKTEDRREGGL